MVVILAAGAAAIAVVTRQSAPSAAATRRRGPTPSAQRPGRRLGGGRRSSRRDAAPAEPERRARPRARDPADGPRRRSRAVRPAPAPLVIGYHEAAHVTATPLVPVGSLGDDRNTTRTSLPPDDPSGVEYLVLTSRGRAAGPTSAVDVVLPEGEVLVSPVTGTVVDVREYQLYGRHTDLRIEIVPDLRPDLRSWS